MREGAGADGASPSTNLLLPTLPESTFHVRLSGARRYAAAVSRFILLKSMMQQLARAVRIAAVVLGAGTSACVPDVDGVDVDERTVVVRALDQNGAGLAGVAVVWWPLDLGHIERNEVGETNAAGQLEFEVSLWSEITIEATPPATHEVAATQANPLDVTLAGRTTVTMGFTRK